jgi:hypothetical protein
MADLVKKVLSSPPGGIAPDEEILGVAMVMKRGAVVGAPSNAAFGGLVETIAADAIRGSMAEKIRAGEGEVSGDAATWPAIDNGVFVITRRRLLVYDGTKGVKKLGEPLRTYPIESVAGISYEKKSIYNVIRVAFADGSTIALDAGKGQRLDDLVASVGLAKG